MERLVGGSRPENSILSADPNVNPYWYDFNTVYVQYCSSDSFLGNISKKDIEWFTPFDFQGANIARGVFKQLVQDHGMHAANNVLLTSVSAGSFGALASGNDIFDYLHDHVPAAKFKVWLDSGFWLLNEPTRPGFAPSNCETTNWVDCRIDGCQSRTKQYFNAVHNRECVAAHPEYTYECAFPEIMWPYIRFPIFVSQQQYDKLQLQGAGLPISDQVDTEAGLAFLLERGDAWREAFKMIDNLWSSNCRKHDIIDKVVHLLLSSTRRTVMHLSCPFNFLAHVQLIFIPPVRNKFSRWPSRMLQLTALRQLRTRPPIDGCLFIHFN